MKFKVKDNLEKEFILTAIKCNPSKLLNRFGRILDNVSLKINSETISGYFDSTWGRYVYY